MVQRSFAAEGTKTKLETIFDYAEFYTTALKNKGFRLTYVDAFAGTGELPTDDEELLPLMPDQSDLGVVMEGSARKALQMDSPFDRYIFNDNKKANAAQLEELKKEFSDKEVYVGDLDANDFILGFCKKMEPKDRALVFLDPFGNQVTFDTLKVIAETNKIDLWYLFPSWWGVVRQIKKDGSPLPDSVPSIDQLFGTSDWPEHMRESSQTMDLFGERTEVEKIADVDNVTKFMIERMKTIFGDGVSNRWLPLTWNNRSSFSLLFACSNPNKKARSLALRVTKDIMTRK